MNDNEKRYKEALEKIARRTNLVPHSISGQFQEIAFKALNPPPEMVWADVQIIICPDCLKHFLAEGHTCPECKTLTIKMVGKRLVPAPRKEFHRVEIIYLVDDTIRCAEKNSCGTIPPGGRAYLEWTE